MNPFISSRPLPALAGRNNRHHAAGFSLIELMVSITIGLVLIAGVTGIFIASKRNYNQDSQVTPMQDNLRFAMAMMQQNVEMAGYWSSVFVPASIAFDATMPKAADWAGCGAATFDGFLDSITYGYTSSTVSTVSVNNAAPADAVAAFPCLIASEYQNGTDAIYIRRLLGAPVADADLKAGHIYVRENGTQGLLFVMGAAAPGYPTGAIVQNWEFDASVFFVRNYYQTAGDGVPTLSRMYLTSVGGKLVWKEEYLAPGIENLQVQYGINSIPSTGKRPTYFTSTPTTTEIAEAVSARISLLARSVGSVSSYTNNKTYAIADSAAYAPNDHFYRKLLESTFVLRNPASLQFYTTPHG